MARCPHGFERAIVPCASCDARERSTTLPAPTASAPAPCRGRPVRYATGQTIAGAEILSRASNEGNGNAAWHCKLACGHERVIQGIALRAAEKARSTLRCHECPKKPRAVPRHG